MPYGNFPQKYTILKECKRLQPLQTIKVDNKNDSRLEGKHSVRVSNSGQYIAQNQNKSKIVVDVFKPHPPINVSD